MLPRLRPRQGDPGQSGCWPTHIGAFKHGRIDAGCPSHEEPPSTGYSAAEKSSGLSHQMPARRRSRFKQVVIDHLLQMKARLLLVSLKSEPKSQPRTVESII